MPRPETLDLEREYVAHRGAVLAMLRSDFGGVPDHEELYQDAWTELLELQAKGQQLKSIRGLLKTIAWRRARDRLRKMKPETIDPASMVIQLQPDTGPLPDEQTHVRLEAAVLRQIIDRLEPRQAAALKLRFDWHLDRNEIQERLGVTEKRLEKIVTEAYKTVAEEAGLDAGGERRWTRKQRSLLLACEMGLASAKQRKRAQQMVDEDPGCRAMLREMRSTLNDVAAALPFPVIVAEERTNTVIPIVDRLGDAWASVKHAVSGVFGRGPGTATAVEQTAGAGGAVIGGGVATKAVMACLATGSVAVCIQSGVIPGLSERPPDAKPPAARTITAAPPKPERTAAVPVVESKSATPAPAPKKKREAKKREEPKRTSTAPTSSPKATPEPSPVPEGTSEFGPGAVGSSSAPATPAQAPADGGGEFGP